MSQLFSGKDIEGGFRYRISLLYRKRLFCAPSSSENAFRAEKGGGVMHRISLPYRKSLFFTPNASDDASRTVGSLFEHRMRIPYRRSLFLVRRASENTSHLVVRSTGKRVAVASERPVYPRTGQRQFVAAAEPGVHFSRPHSGHEVATPPQR